MYCEFNGHSHGRRLTEAVAPTHGYDAQDPDRQICEADFELEGVPARSAYGVGHQI
jgi:hypothetical protein